MGADLSFARLHPRRWSLDLTPPALRILAMWRALRLHKPALVTGLALALLASPVNTRPAAALAAGSAWSGVRHYSLLTKPPRTVRLDGTPLRRSRRHSRQPVPFLPLRANPLGRRSGGHKFVVPIAAASVTEASRGPLSEQELAGFPLMDLTRQITLYGEDQAVQPPDTQLAAGPANLAEADNSILSVWSRTGTLVTSADLNTFFALPAGFSFSDPRILYDQLSGRWFLTGLSFDALNDSKEYIAVSTTSDAGGSWKVYVVTSMTAVLGDQPMVGVSADKAVISWNDFNGSPLSFSGQETWVLQKSDLLAGVALHTFAIGPDNTRVRLVPALTLSSTSTEWLSYDNADCAHVCNIGSPTIGVVAINGTPLTSVTVTESDPAIAATTDPSSPRQPSGVPVTAQIDDRFLSVVWQSGRLWAAGNDGCIPGGDSTTRSCMRLVQVSTTGTPAVVTDFDAASNGVDLYYPAVTLDSSGDLFVAYSMSSSSLDPSAAAVDSLAAWPTSLQNVITIAAGQTSYLQGTNRWGDYSAAVQDPLNPADVWLTAEYQASAIDAGDWGTATARVAIQVRTPVVQSGPSSPATRTGVNQSPSGQPGPR
jgi:hypothetical protein